MDDPADARSAAEAFAAGLELGGHRYDLRIEADPAYKTIKSVADRMSPELLGIGTRSMGGRHVLIEERRRLPSRDRRVRYPRGPAQAPAG